ncbi:hypothetical protein [Caulobacter sp. BE254]|uniref:hypothetical protein n=1 Tax=Caulobacter sp. BE254 TaxID=2817720 RepID=UPI0028623809|nr:hypothetical protein [Caulobacter sp. BE254]MDR7117383.1 hypothetical protein [Caulobacter sp. BE254]
MLERKPNPVSTYRALVQDAKASVVGPSAIEFQRRFNGFYGVRRNADWRGQFYDLFEAARTSEQTHQVLFETVLLDLYAKTGRVEASFVSKLVATLRPEAPIIDSIVSKFMAKRLPKPVLRRAPDSAAAYYKALDEILRRMQATAEARSWSQWFDQTFPTPTGGLAIGPMKKLDFLIWAGSTNAPSPKGSSGAK